MRHTSLGSGLSDGDHLGRFSTLSPAEPQSRLRAAAAEPKNTGTSATADSLRVWHQNPVRGKKQRANIYVFNAEQRLDRGKSKTSHDISNWSRDVTRLVDVFKNMSRAPRDHVCGIDVIEYDYLAIAKAVKDGNPSSDRKLTWKGWHYTTLATKTESETPAKHLATIPTALKITAAVRHSRCANLKVELRNGATYYKLTLSPHL